MGTTATSLHILRSSGNTASLSGEIEKAYRRLGYARPKKPAGISAKQVILVGRDDDDFLSICDSDNDQIDTGELKDLAVQLSKRLASVAILTSIYDGDTFEFVLFHKGKQVDAAVSDPGSHQGGLKFLAGKRRAQAWLDMFYIRDLIRARGAGAPGAFSQRHAVEQWQDELKKVEASESLAENELAEWCEVVGLDPDRAFANYGDFTRRAAADGQIMLTLERTGSPLARRSRRPPPMAPSLSNIWSPRTTARITASSRRLGRCPPGQPHDTGGMWPAAGPASPVSRCGSRSRERRLCASRASVSQSIASTMARSPR